MADVQTNDHAESSAPNGPATLVATLPIYRMTYEIIAHNIRQAVIPVGAILLVAHIAEKFGISRAPVYQALDLLVADGLIRKAVGHGYLVTAGRDGQPPAIKLDLDATTLRLPGTLQNRADGEPLRTVPIWRTIYDEVEQELVERAVHGRFRLLEARLASHYRVSRTVAKEVIAQLQINGLVEHNRSSQWHTVPMTTKAVTNRYDIRRLLEPYALRLAAPHLTSEFLRTRLQRAAEEIQLFPDAPSKKSMRLEWDLHVDCLAPCGNEELMRVLQRSQNYPIVNHAQFARKFHNAVPHHYPQEHQEVLEYLAAGNVDAAVDSLEAHLISAYEKTLKRLVIMTREVIGGPLSYILPVS